MRKLFVAAMTAAFGLTPATAGADFTTASTVLGIDVGDTGMLYIRFADATMCGSHIVYVPRSAAYYPDALASAMSAFSTGKKLSVWISACPSQGYPEAVRLVTGYVW